MEANVLRTDATSSPTGWRATHTDLAAAMAASDIVALVGSQGSGKTHALRVLAQAAPAGTAKMRIAGEARAPGITLDLVDGMDAAPAFAGTMVAAISPHELAPFQLAHPGARVVKLRPMSGDNTRAMIELRRRQLGLPSGAITLRAQAALERRCGGHPGALDMLLRLADRAVKADHASRISADHVERAWTELTAPSGAAVQPAPSIASSAPPKAAAPKLKPKPEVVAGPVAKAPAPVAAPPRASAMSAWETLNTPLELPTAPGWSMRRPSRRRQVRGLAALVVVAAVSGAALTRWEGVTAAAAKLQAYADAALAGTRQYMTTLDDPRQSRQPPTRASTPPGGPDSRTALRPSSLLPEVAPVTAPVQAQAGPLLPAAPMRDDELNRSGYFALLYDAPGPSLSDFLPHPALPPALSQDGAVLPAPSVVPDLAASAPAAPPRPPGLTPPAPTPEHQVRPPDTRPSQDAAAVAWRAAQLLGFGRALVSIGEVNDAKKMFEASAALGNAEANAAYRALTASSPEPPKPKHTVRLMNSIPAEQRGPITHQG